MNFRRKKKKVKTFAEMTPEEKQTQMEKLAYLFERMRLGDYVNNFNRPWRVFYMNVLEFLKPFPKGFKWVWATPTTFLPSYTTLTNLTPAISRMRARAASEGAGAASMTV